MDDAYARAAAEHDFLCAGCEESCCETLFFHHTLAESLALWAGVEALPEPAREALLERAGRVRQAEADHGPGSGTFRHPCPALEEGRCLLYEDRPMVCRLHGIGYTMVLPDGSCRTGPGCHAYEQRMAQSNVRPSPMDRTLLYRDMADLERELRLATGFSRRIPLTVAGLLAGPPVRLPGMRMEDAS